MPNPRPASLALLVGVVLFGLGVAAGLWLPALLSPVPPGIEPRWEATIYLPVPVADDPRLNEDAWKAALAELLTEPFTGATLGVPVEGLWRGEDGRLGREAVRPVVV